LVLFPDDVLNSCRRWQSLNYIDSHDGLNLCDLVSYTNDANRSWNCGFEGANGAPADVVRLRRQQVKNFCCLLMLSNGTPMFCAGDEFMNTQGGDANPYNQDNETTWLDWSLVDQNAEVLRFFAMMIGLRKAHPSIGRDVGWGGDITWIGASSGSDEANSHAIAFHLSGAAAADSDLYVMINAFWEPVQFSIGAVGEWRRIVDTSLASPLDVVAEQSAPSVNSASYTVSSRSVVALLRWGAKRLPCRASRYIVGRLKCINKEWTPFALSSIGVREQRVVETWLGRNEKCILESREDRALDRDRAFLHCLRIS
jgi:isoamylase